MSEINIIILLSYMNTQQIIDATGTAYESLHNITYHAIIGPQCSQVCGLVGRLAAYLNIPVFSGVCQSVEMANKYEFKVMMNVTERDLSL